MNKLAPLTSGVIIAGVFSLVFLSAGSIVWKTAQEKHSTAHVVVNFFSDKPLLTYQMADAQMANPLTTTSIPDTLTLINASSGEVSKVSLKTESLATVSTECVTSFLSVAKGYNYSLVDYLSQKGSGISFQDRNEIAQTLGMSNYTGTTEQNENVMLLLFIKFNAVPPGICISNGNG